MSGIYIHIPFCKQACHYCDFHFSTNLSLRREMVESICKEIELRSDYLPDKDIQTIYFGGGTPSLLEEAELNRILDSISKIFPTSGVTEITLEANPDDLQKEKLKTLVKNKINRLSIGIQSFNDGFLQYLNRAHSGDEASLSVKEAQEAGIENISIDLIYGIPSSNHLIWEQDLKQALALNIQHISSYCLTIEPKTVFGRWNEKGKIKDIEEEFSAQQFEILYQTLQQNEFEQYEISNFSKPGFISKHNSNYWREKTYLGLGPSAHSFNQVSRQCNISQNNQYIQAIAQGKIPATVEILSEQDKVNEYLLTSLRTKWGCNVDRLEKEFNIPEEKILGKINSLSSEGLISYEKKIIRLTLKGRLFADKITADFFI